MGQSIVVNQAEFEQAVLQPSFDQPVLVDFFATWCGPCQLLKPMLESLAQEYDFTLAKVDIDQNPELAKAFGVEGVPDVRIVTQGQVQEGFVGVLPEPQLRELLSGLGLQSSLENDLKIFEVAQATADPAEIFPALTTLLTRYPNNGQILIKAAQVYLAQGDDALASQYLDLIDPSDRTVADQGEGVRGLLTLRQSLTDLGDEPLDHVFRVAVGAALASDFESALGKFLEIVRCDRTYRHDGARKAMLTVFKLLGHDDPLTLTYRKQLMQALY
ncbi:tetratricopeptide repeat protein [Nodosilinea sp. LEGE 07088]|uniref:tetratricopeptide repeat protein n=1 Tax=Nodosilinea sp. LEGE 07088 TaxID=2777968 RepID=UPI00187E6DAD|nr:tetratricopeptide repeat protein [Nodosilinea sp. LEGE 07088]MBE9135893.1 tetratricopeptide repeat protein [Nodosilinea sp. LEGE 07088]